MSKLKVLALQSRLYFDDDRTKRHVRETIRLIMRNNGFPSLRYFMDALITELYLRVRSDNSVERVSEALPPRARRALSKICDILLEGWEE